MGVLLPNYMEENVVKGETGTLPNVFQILQDLWLKQTRTSLPSTTATTCIATQLTPLMMYGPTSANQNTDMMCIATQPTPLTTYGYTSANQNHQSTGMATPITSMSESLTFPRTTMPAETTPSSRQSTQEIHQNSLLHTCTPTTKSSLQPEELPALRKVKTPHNGKTSMNRSPLTKQEISSQFSGCFEEIGCFPGDLCKFHLQPDHQMARHVSKKQGIPEEVKEHADWVHSNIFVEKALERKSYQHTLQGRLQQNFQGEWNMPDISQHTWKCAWMTTSLRPQREPNNSIFKTSAMQNSHQA